MKLGTILAAVLALSMGAAQAQTVNCAKAKTADERTVCADPQLVAIDREIARAHASAVRNVGAAIINPITAAYVNARRNCGRDANCILNMQSLVLQEFEGLSRPAR